MSPSVVVEPTAAEKGLTEEPFEAEEALVEGLRAGEQLAQLVLFKRYGPRVKHLIKSISWDLAEEDAKEVRERRRPDRRRRHVRRGYDVRRVSNPKLPWSNVSLKEAFVDPASLAG